MSGRSRRSFQWDDEDSYPPSSRSRSRSQIRPVRRSSRLRAAAAARQISRSSSRSENGERRSDSEDIPGGRDVPSFHVIVEIDRPSPAHSFMAPRSENGQTSDSDDSMRESTSSASTSFQQQLIDASPSTGSILAGVESHLLLLRRSLLLLSHLAQPTPTVHFLEDKPPTPPTSSAFIDNIPVSRINEPGVECCICLAKFRRGTRASVLPCQHQFHNRCIKPWLKKKNSCPLCRYRLPSEEPSRGRRRNAFHDTFGSLSSFSLEQELDAAGRPFVLTERDLRELRDLSSSSSSSSLSSSLSSF